MRKGRAGMARMGRVAAGLPRLRRVTVRRRGRFAGGEAAGSRVIRRSPPHMRVCAACGAGVGAGGMGEMFGLRRKRHRRRGCSAHGGPLRAVALLGGRTVAVIAAR